MVPRVCEQPEQLLLSMTGTADAARHASMCEMKHLPPVSSSEGDAHKRSFQSLLRSSQCVVLQGDADAGDAHNCFETS